MAQLKAKRTQLTLMQNSEILDALKAQWKITEIVAQFNYDRSTISKIKTNEGKFRHEELTNKKSNKACSRKSNFHDVEEALLQWFTQIRLRNAILSGPLMLEKANQFAILLIVEGFTVSNG